MDALNRKRRVMPQQLEKRKAIQAYQYKRRILLLLF
jgi:hypothetical protein